MKYILFFALYCAGFYGFMRALDSALEKQERIDHLRAVEHCEKYADAGACLYVKG